jgi:hypothetical protein
MSKDLEIPASVLDSTHLELDQALPKSLGKRLKVHITPLTAQEHTTREGRVTYQVEATPESRLQVVLDAKEAMIAANRFIVEHLPDRFSAGLPKLVQFPLQPLWLVPVHLTYPGVGMVGEVGMVAVDGERPIVVGWTPPEEMEALAHRLYEEKRNEIEILAIETSCDETAVMIKEL